MRYRINNGYIDIQHDDKTIECIPIKTLTNKRLGEMIRYLSENAEYTDDIKLKIEFSDKTKN